MSPWPDWRLLALIGCALVAVAAAAGILTIIGGAILSRRAGGHQVPGDGQPPVPGNAPGSEAASPPARPSPAPGLPCTCGDTGWVTTLTPSGVMQRPCRDCLGPVGRS